MSRRFTVVVLEHFEKGLAIIADLIVLNQTNVLSGIFARRSIHAQWFRQNAVEVLHVLMIGSLDEFVLFGVQDDRFRTKVALIFQFFQPLKSQSKEMGWKISESNCRCYLNFDRLIGRSNAALESDRFSRFDGGVLRIVTKELELF